MQPYGEFITDLSSTATIHESCGARAISLRLFTAKAPVPSRISLCRICGEQSENGTDVFPSTSVFARQYLSTGTQNPCHLSTINATQSYHLKPSLNKHPPLLLIRCFQTNNNPDRKAYSTTILARSLAFIYLENRTTCVQVQ